MTDIVKIISLVSTDMIKDSVNNNESTFESIESIDFTSDLNNNSTENLIFNMLWQIGVRWKSCVLLLENEHNIGLNIILRSIYESQRKLEFILSDSTKTRTKILSHKLNIIVEELKAHIIDDIMPDHKVTLSSLIEQFELEEINDLVLENFNDKHWRRYNWLKLFNEGSNFSEMTRILDPETQEFGTHIFKILSTHVHGNRTEISNLISINEPFKESISKKTLIYLFAILVDFEIVSGMFITQHYPNYLEKWKKTDNIILLFNRWQDYFLKKMSLPMTLTLR